jgi:formate hydrogenlyase subunit 4/hydrogenase-4 membrane subunit HyfE
MIILIQFVLVLLIAPFASGWVRFLKARLQGRKGASPFLPYVSLATMLKKETIIPSASSWIFRAVPLVVLASALGLALMVPTIVRGGLMANFSDFLVVAGVLMIGSIFLVLGGLDAGSAFGGMGSSREMTMAALLEPTLVMIFATYSFVTGSFTIDGMLSQSLIAAYPFLLLSILALAMLALGENARYPVDNPATHLELTMIHEAMILEYSGPHLAMLEYASMLKLTVFSFLASNFVFPASLISADVSLQGLLVGIILAVLKVLVVMMALALLESTIVKMRFYRMNEFVSISFVAAFFGMATALFSKILDVVVSYEAFFSALAIFFAVFLFGNIRSRSVVRYYVLSSLSIAAIAATLAFSDSESKMHLLLFALGTILIKVVAVPWIIAYIIKHHKNINQLQTFLKPTPSYFLAGAILVVAFFVINAVPFLGAISLANVLYASIVLVMLGVMKMVINRNLFSQIVGLLVLENGLALFTLVTIKTFPIVIESGIFAVTIISVFILSKLSMNIKELYGSTDTEELRNLTD